MSAVGVFLQQFLLQYCITLASFTGHSQILPRSRGEKSPIFLHGCDIKSGSGLGTRLACHITEGEITIYLLSISCSNLAMVVCSW